MSLRRVSAFSPLFINKVIFICKSRVFHLPFIVIVYKTNHKFTVADHTVLYMLFTI